MGFNINKANEKREEIINSFYPIALSEGNVLSIFNGCLATGDERITYARVLQPALSGKQSDLIRFSKERIDANSKNISYLFGQLSAVHQKEDLILLEYGIMRYDGTAWTKSEDTLLKLYELGMVNIDITPFVLQENKSLTANISTIKPTLSPKDPNFPAWWEAHKSEWEVED